MAPIDEMKPLEPLPHAMGGTLRLVSIYAVFSCLWILLSDKAVELLIGDTATMTVVSTLKGWLFVAVTSLLLYVLVRRLIEQVLTHALSEREARTESKRTSQLLAAIIDSSSDAIFAKDLQGRFLMINREAARVTGSPSELTVGRDASALFPAEQAELIRAIDKRVIAENRINTYEERLSTVDGERVFLATKGPLRDGDGRVIGIYGISRDITERKQAEEALRKSEANFRNFFEKNSSVMLLIDPASGAIIDANKAAIDYYGYSGEKLVRMLISDINTLPPERVTEERQRALRGERETFFFSHRLASGDVRDVEVHLSPITSDERPMLLSIVHDITHRKQAEAALRVSEERLRLAFNASNQGWFDVDLRSGEIDVSPEYVRMIGYTLDDFSSDLPNWLEHVHPDDRDALTVAMQVCIEDGGPNSMEYRRQTKIGDWRWIRSIGKIVQWDENRHAVRMIGIHTDITERKQMEEQVRQLAFFDPLTRLPNRRLLNDRLSQAMAISKRSGNYCALMFADLDNFKPLNDTHGHEVGDLLLIEVADRLKGCVREMDTVARFGGDEFVIIVCELDSDKTESGAQAFIVAEKIRVTLARPYVLRIRHEGTEDTTVEHQCSACIGVALFVNHVISHGEILKAADQAMYRAKEAGRNSIRFGDQKE
jgi:diguanylate cyclase (GGDEF)-like protein/PAS domain S-box-containing protein